jgi:hypothetical protein
MATMAELRQANEGIETQMQEWKQQRFANGENPMDWVAFRQHVQQLGASDPGETPPDEFYRWDDGMAGGQPDASSATQGTNPAQQPGQTGAQPHAFAGGQVSEVNSLSGDAAANDDAGAGNTTSNWPEPKRQAR